MGFSRSAVAELFQGFGAELLQLGAHGEFLDVAEMVDEQLPGQMVHLVLGRAGKKTVQARLLRFPVEAEVLAVDWAA